MTNGIEQPFVVQLDDAGDDLRAALAALGIPYEAHGAGIRVALDAGIDGRLESLIGRLSDLRWGYTPGRAIQVQLPGLAFRGQHAHRSP